MSLAALLDRADDWMNPIVVKELRQAVKSRIVVAILMLFLGVQLFILTTMLLVREVSGDASVDWNAGARVFAWQQGILLCTLMLFVPAYAAIRLGSERSEHNVDLLFISTLRPSSIIWGKLFAALVLALLVYSTCAPFMTFTYLLRGIDIPTIVSVLVVDLLAMLLATMLALTLAAVPGGRVVKFVVVVLGFIGLGVLCIVLTVDTVGLIGGEQDRMPVQLILQTSAGGVVAVGVVLSLVGLLFFYAVAMISPPSSNRVLPMRVYYVAVWLATGAAMFLASGHGRTTPHFGFVIAWVVCATLLSCIQFTISVCERERWGPRLARAIPRRLLLRPAAWLFYTGAAGGVALTTLLQVVTFAAALWWCDRYPGGTAEEECRRVVAFLALVWLYFYCYGLTAVLVRRYLLDGQIKTGFTWLVGLLLVGIGSSVPSIIAWIFFPDQLRYNTDGGWWLLSNPFMAIYEVLSLSSRSGGSNFETLCFWFLGTWAVLVSLLCLPWFLGQLISFAPPRMRDVERAPVAVFEAPAPLHAGGAGPSAPETAQAAAVQVESIHASSS